MTIDQINDQLSKATWGITHRRDNRSTQELPIIADPEILADDDQIVANLRHQRRRRDQDAALEDLINTRVCLPCVEMSR